MKCILIIIFSLFSCVPPQLVNKNTKEKIIEVPRDITTIHKPVAFSETFWFQRPSGNVDIVIVKENSSTNLEFETIFKRSIIKLINDLKSLELLKTKIYFKETPRNNSLGLDLSKVDTDEIVKTLYPNNSTNIFGSRSIERPTLFISSSQILEDLNKDKNKEFTPIYLNFLSTIDSQFITSDNLLSLAAIDTTKKQLLTRNHSNIILFHKKGSNEGVCSNLNEIPNIITSFGQYFLNYDRSFTEQGLCNAIPNELFNNLVDNITNYKSRIILSRKLAKKPVIKIDINKTEYFKDVHFKYLPQTNEIIFIPPEEQNVTNELVRNLPREGEEIKVKYFTEDIDELVKK